MCGIVGILNLNEQPIDKNILINMTNEVSHRGPDGDGYYVNKNIGFGHKRLSIIDLSDNGSQPMKSKDGRFILNYNGELYNFKDLRQNLEKRGCEFYTESDTEVVLRSWEEWGEKCVNKFNGMFAFAIWDNKNKDLFLIRDRYGTKPLYYSNHKNYFIFSSEQKSFFKNPFFKKEINKESLLEYFTFQNIFTDNTFLQNTKILMPATIMKINSTGRVSSDTYWDYSFTNSKIKKKEDELIDELEYLFDEAVKRQMFADVEVGCYLSGGIDSSTISSFASKNCEQLKTFTCGFDLSGASGVEFNFDERKSAKKTSDYLKTKYFETTINSKDMENSIKQVSKSIEEPRLGQSYPNYIISRFTSKHVKVALSGTGGDELFCGYPWRYFYSDQKMLFEDFIDHYYVYWQRLLDNSQIKKSFLPIWKDINHVWTRDIFRDVFKNIKTKYVYPNEYINLSLYFECKTFLHSLLIIEDKLGMANNLETRFPFLDNHIVDFAMNCPNEFKLNNFKAPLRIDENTFSAKKEKYFLKTNDGKKILRKLAKRSIPLDISNSIKQGFSGPDNSWFKGESINYVKSIIGNKNSRIYEFFDFKNINNIVDQHLKGKMNKRLLIWSLLSFEEWIIQNL
ncbi:asparagine synthase (glutamine-hydrolyzing) [Pelagibacteraceae bacterium]|nr:asparagine synthase (glutamine-hydrolyzing) [Pelagibacteraceae bacterium]